jgi:hypothetical protein
MAQPAVMRPRSEHTRLRQQSHTQASCSGRSVSRLHAAGNSQQRFRQLAVRRLATAASGSGLDIPLDFKQPEPDHRSVTESSEAEAAALHPQAAPQRLDAVLVDAAKACETVEDVVALARNSAARTSPFVAAALASVLELRLRMATNSRGRREWFKSDKLAPVADLLAARLPDMSVVGQVQVLALCSAAAQCPIFDGVGDAAAEHLLSALSDAKSTPLWVGQVLQVQLVAARLANVRSCFESVERSPECSAKRSTKRGRKRHAKRADVAAFHMLSTLAAARTASMLEAAQPSEVVSTAKLLAAQPEGEAELDDAPEEGPSGRAIALRPSGVIGRRERRETGDAIAAAMCRALPAFSVTQACIVLSALRKCHVRLGSVLPAVADVWLTPQASAQLPMREATQLLWEFREAGARLDPSAAAAAMHVALRGISDAARPGAVAKLASLTAAERALSANDMLPVADYVVRQAHRCSAAQLAHMLSALLARGCAHDGALAAFRGVALPQVAHLDGEQLAALAACAAAPELVRAPALQLT